MLAQNNVSLSVTDGAVDWLAEQGYDPMFGARPIKRTLQHYLVNELSKEILAGRIDPGQRHYGRRRKGWTEIRQLNIAVRALLHSETEGLGMPRGECLGACSFFGTCRSKRAAAPSAAKNRKTGFRTEPKPDFLSRQTPFRTTFPSAAACGRTDIAGRKAGRRSAPATGARRTD